MKLLKILLVIFISSTLSNCSVSNSNLNEPNISDKDIKLEKNDNEPLISLKEKEPEITSETKGLTSSKYPDFFKKRIIDMENLSDGFTFSFNLSKDDLKRVFIFTIKSISKDFKVLVNDEVSFDPQNISFDFKEISVEGKNFKEGENKLEISNNKNIERVILDGFLEPKNIEGAVDSIINSLVYLDIIPYYLEIKFIEGMKVRSNSETLFDENGISLTSFYRLLHKYGYDSVYKSSSISYDELDEFERNLESTFNRELPNKNLFYGVSFSLKTNFDILKVRDELRTLPFIEEVIPRSFPFPA